jgi:hypothetical protein
MHAGLKVLTYSGGAVGELGMHGLVARFARWVRNGCKTICGSEWLGFCNSAIATASLVDDQQSQFKTQHNRV